MIQSAMKLRFVYYQLDICDEKRFVEPMRASIR